MAIGDVKHEHTHRHPLVPGITHTPEHAAACRRTNPGWPAPSSENGSNQPDSRTGRTHKRGLATAATSAMTEVVPVY